MEKAREQRMSSPPTHEDRIGHLLDELDEHSEGRDEDAQAELIRIGAAALPALVQRAPNLSPGGQLCAIEVFRELEVAESEGVLIDLLSSENATVRQWAAEAVGHLGMTNAVPELRSLLLRSRDARTAPDEIEPVSARHALTALGARTPVMPAGFREVMKRDDRLGIVVPEHLLTTAIEALSADGQVVAYFQRWRPWNDTRTGVDGSSFHFDWDAPWADLVEQSLDQAAAAAAGLAHTEDVVVTIEWLGVEDWPTELK